MILPEVKLFSHHFKKSIVKDYFEEVKQNEANISFSRKFWGGGTGQGTIVGDDSLYGFGKIVLSCRWLIFAIWTTLRTTMMMLKKKMIMMTMCRNGHWYGHWFGDWYGHWYGIYGIYGLWYIGASFSLSMLISTSKDEDKDHYDDDKEEMTMTMCRYGRCANGLMCSNCNRCQGCSFQVRLESL